MRRLLEWTLGSLLDTVVRGVCLVSFSVLWRAFIGLIVWPLLGEGLGRFRCSFAGFEGKGFCKSYLTQSFVNLQIHCGSFFLQHHVVLKGWVRTD